MCRVGTQTAPDPGPFSPSLISHGPNLHTTGECFFFQLPKLSLSRKMGLERGLVFSPLSRAFPLPWTLH